MQQPDEDVGGGSSGEGLFHAAADHLGQLVRADPRAVPDSLKLQLYGLYKQATAGPCDAPKPRFWERAARAKWRAWSQLGALQPEPAQARYVQLLGQHDPQWLASAQATGARRPGRQGGVGGPVFSTLAHAGEEQQQGQAGGGSSLHELAGQGDLAGLRAALDAGAAVDGRDDCGCSALHFAADRGRVDAAQLLLDAGADIDARDADGQAPLHYAATCEQLEVCRLLLQRGADAGLVDAEGQTPAQLGPAAWTCWLS